MRTYARLRSLLGTLLVLFLVAACGNAVTPPSSGTANGGAGQGGAVPEPTSAPGGPGIAPSLEGTNWFLTAYGPADEPITPQKGTEVTLQFTGGKLSGRAGCNQYGTTYQLDGAKLTVEAASRTEMACVGNGVMEQEDAYLAALSTARSLAVNGNDLTIAYDGGELHFSKVEPVADKSLEDTPWRLSAFGKGEAVSSLLVGSEITAQFSGGRVSGTAGCNTYSGDYRREDAALTFGELVSTRMACDPAITAQESDYLAALRDVKSLIIKGTQLSLDHDAGTLIFTAAQ